VNGGTRVRARTSSARGNAKAALKIAFDSRPASAPDGVGRYTRCLLEAMREVAGEKCEILESSRPRRADIFHAPWPQGALLRAPCPMVVTIHDLFELKRPGERMRKGLRMQLRFLAVQRALRVIVPTEAVAGDVQDHLGIAPRRIAVIAEAPAAAMFKRTPAEIERVRARYGLPEEYLLWVGDMRHPDHSRALAKLAAAPRRVPLVLTGPTTSWAHELPGVTLTGLVPDDHLAAIYSGARALLMASAEEGFGLPSVEALACGTPVVACESAALREVLGERARFVAPGDFGGLLAAAEELGGPAPQAPSWSWQDAARRTLEVYRAALREAAEGRTPAIGSIRAPLAGPAGRSSGQEARRRALQSAVNMRRDA
jgi:glycosyltransferase involved in cell wall biosynthesis